MIYTVTFNPSLDYIVGTKGFQLGETNRSISELILPGGKGINVSTVLKNLGIESTALGFTAGFTGEEIRRRVDELGVANEFIDAGSGFSRINVKMKEFDGTEINGQGPHISRKAVEKLFMRLGRLEEGDILVLAGSIPSCMEDSVYSDILSQMYGRGIDFVVDATKDLLLNVLKYHPFLIKPNHHELGEIFGVGIQGREEVPEYARLLQEKGARNVLVSMGGMGAALLDEEGKLHMLPAPKGQLVNAVGSGDSMVAGFLAGWAESKDYEHAFKMGVASGSASAFSELLATKDEIQTLYQRLQ